MGIVFSEITLIICLAAILSVVFRFLKQPAILAYILTGITVGPIGIFKLHNQDILQVLSQIGITLLLFMLGLEIRIKDFLSIGRLALIIAAFQIIFSIIFFFLLSLLLGFVPLTALYIGIALMDSSIIIVLKLMSDKKDLHSLYGKISIGILLVQDFAAIFVLIFLAAFNPGTGAESLFDFILVILKAVLLFGFVWWLSQTFLPKIVDKLSSSSETLFLVSIAFVFGLAMLVSSPLIGFSVEIGGFLAGLALANSIANYQIIAKAKVLRDFFIVLFFVLIGIKMSFGEISQIFWPAIIFSIAVLTIKPLIVMAVMGIMGFRKRSSFLTGIGIGQTSEFSLIIVYLGNKIGHIPQSAVSMVILISIITFVVSTYMIVNGNKLYILLGRYLKVFERKNTIQQEAVESWEDLDKLKDHVVLIGGDQMGESILDALQNLGSQVIVIDFDPSIVKKLKNKNTLSIYGDISDLDIQEKAKLSSARLVISTIPDIEDNLLLLRKHKYEKEKAKIVVMALDSTDARILYREGADYVILPHLAGGRQIAKILKDNQLEEIFKLRTMDMAYLA